jgi:hypothetical protein
MSDEKRKNYLCDVVVAAKPQIPNTNRVPQALAKVATKENTSGGGGEQPGN